MLKIPLIMLEVILNNIITFFLIFTNHCYYTPSEVESKYSSKGFICQQCRITFDNMDDEEEHIKLEHTEHRLPSGCA